jgi:hypothetical protein
MTLAILLVSLAFIIFAAYVFYHASSIKLDELIDSVLQDKKTDEG